MRLGLLRLVILCASGALGASLLAQVAPLPTTRLLPAPTLAVPGRVDSSVPMTWTRIDGLLTLVAFASWGGAPVRMAGPNLEGLEVTGDLIVTPPPGHGIWIESVIPDETDTSWYAYYHDELGATVCERLDRQIPRIGAAVSTDRGVTWQNLGTILEAPPGSEACSSPNRYVIGGVGDVSAMVDHDWKDVYFYFSNYGRDPRTQGVIVARLAWADRDAPRGRVTIWQDGVWLPPVPRPLTGTDDVPLEWDYPAGTPILRPTSPWHDGQEAADAFWGPSLHWNTSVQRYVMMLNRTRDESFTNEGLYVSFAAALDPHGWSEPHKVLNGGGWYPQVAGLEPGTGTDKLMGRRGRFLVTGRSNRYIEFTGR
jgi:hypothetical protein